MGSEGQDQQDSHHAGHTWTLQAQGSNEERGRGTMKAPGGLHTDLFSDVQQWHPWIKTTEPPWYSLQNNFLQIFNYKNELKVMANEQLKTFRVQGYSTAFNIETIRQVNGYKLGRLTWRSTSRLSREWLLLHRNSPFSKRLQPKQKGS